MSLQRKGACALAIGFCLAWAPRAHAELTLVERGGWRVYTDGRINTFASLGFGDEFPVPTPNTDGGPPHSVIGDAALGAAGQKTDQGDAANKYFAIRGRNGFLGTVLGFGVTRDVTPTTKAKGFVALWGHAESFNRDRVNTNAFDVREGYLNLEGPWGSFTAGRTLGLFGRISTEIDFNYGHNFGLGYPCGDAQGPACGHIGTGVMFPGFAAGFQYSTPALAGLRLHGGVYDPVRLLGAWNRAAIPRPEAALSYEGKLGPVSLLKLQAEGMVQQVSRPSVDEVTGAQSIIRDEVWGAALGGRIEVGPVRFGAAAFRGKGLGQYYALQNSPAVFSTGTYEIRSFTGLYAQAALVFGHVQVSAGVGRVTIDQLEVDKRNFNLSNAKSQTGVSAAVYYGISDSLVLGLDYFRFQTDWYGAPRSGLGADGAPQLLAGFLQPERQVVNYINAGVTYHW
jgi:hypothetical protein